VAGRPGGGRAVAPRPRSRLLALVGPGLLVAATGVGAGDLATAAFTGNALGVAVLWAVVAGAGIKYVLNEGLARWQLATGETLLEGALTRWRGRLAGPLRVAFLAYFLTWSFLVAAALMSACGAVAHAVWPLTGSADGDKLLYGLAHSAAGVVLVRLGGFRLFERVMGAAAGLMFVTVVATAVRVAPDWGAVAAGLLVPRIPDLPGATGWTVALMGGVGGTLTVLCYGYWIREEGRESPADLGLCRLDLGVGYAMTALFGIAMVVVGSTVEVAGSGAGLVVALADRLEATLGPAGRWTFLAGAWAAVATSLLGVWQSVPYLFADQWRLLRDDLSLLPTAAEEFIRWASPVFHFRRTATRDTELRGVPIKRGDKVVLWYVSANFDEDVFPDPFRFDVTRRPNDHAAFGPGGPHFCLGAWLARLEVRVMLEELLPRIAGMELAGPVRRIRSNFANGFKQMPVRVRLA